MKILILILTPLLLFSKVHYAKLEPIETITLKSAISAQVTLVKMKLEGKRVSKDIIIKLDSRLDHIKLKSIKESITLIKKMLNTNREILSTLEDSFSRQEEYYNRIDTIQSASQTQKNNAFYSFVNSKTQYLSTKEKIDSLKKQLVDLNYQIALLKDSISKKTISVKNRFIDKIFVNRGDYVNMGTPLAQLKDLTSAKLVLFLEADELKNIKNRRIYIDNKGTNYKISKIWSVTDEKYISSYRAEILIKNPKELFSKLLKVEFK